MSPNLEDAAVKAVETVERFGLDPRRADPLSVLERLNNVYLISHDSPLCQIEANQDAVTLVNKAASGLQYIVIYNMGIEPYKLRFALARELAHIILEHDGNSPEDIWSSEAVCFAYHFLCPLPIIRVKKINYRPLRINLSWEMKDMIVFDSVDDMKSHIVDEQNRYNRFLGKPGTYEAADVELVKQIEHDRRVGWKNCYDIVLNGKVIGHCGE